MVLVKKKRIRCVKPEIRVVGIDDGFFVPHTRGVCDVIGVVFRGGYWLEGVMRTQIQIDGMDATEKIAIMILDSSHHGQVRVILLDGVTFAGFNVVDAESLWKRTGLPVIAVTRKKPNFTDIRKALENLPCSEERWRAISNAHTMTRVATRGKEGVFIQAVGVDIDVASQIVKATATRSCVPEALRVAHLIAAGLTTPATKRSSV